MMESPDDDLTVRLGQVEVNGEKHLLPVGVGGFSYNFLCGDRRIAGAVVTPLDEHVSWFDGSWCAFCVDWVNECPLEVLYITAPEDGEPYSVVLP